MTMFSARNWREYPHRYRLEASKFMKSGKTYYPKRLIDPETGDTEQETVNLPLEGKIITFTIIRIPPKQWADVAPYALAIAELTDGTRIMGQVTDCNPDDLKIGMDVRLEFRRIQHEGSAGVISYGHKFVPKWY